MNWWWVLSLHTIRYIRIETGSDTLAHSLNHKLSNFFKGNRYTFRLWHNPGSTQRLVDGSNYSLKMLKRLCAIYFLAISSYLFKRGVHSCAICVLSHIPSHVSVHGVVDYMPTYSNI